MNYINTSRERFSMDKDWRFHLGEISDHETVKGHAGYYDYTKAGGIGGAAKCDWNDNQWEKVNLPHDWANHLDFSETASMSQGYKPRGIGWYRKLFKLQPEDRDKHIIIEFDGIATNAAVYFNGSRLEQNWGGYNSFAVDVSDRIFWGNRLNTLAVRVDADAWEGWWYEGAGIYRHVWLTKKSLTHIAHWGIWVNPLKIAEGVWTTQIETTLENSSYEDQTVTLVSKIIDSSGNELGRAESEIYCSAQQKIASKQDIPIKNPLLWDIVSPNLYTLKSEVYVANQLIDDETTRFGYRTIAICPETGFYLNDRKIKIKGTANHQDHAGVGTALPDSIHHYRISKLKEMGSNAYRCAHGNPAKELLDACDELGMMVMDENRRFESSPEGIKQVTSMVKRDRNHPSVIMYSIFNEESLQGTPQGRAIARKLIHTIKSLDETRFVTAAMNGGFFEQNGVATVVDITGFNYNLDKLDDFHCKHPTQPILGTENNCAFSTRGIYISDVSKQQFNSYDEEKAGWGNTICETWECINSRNYVAGMFVWTGFDYRGEPTPYKWPSISSHWGAIDTCGFPKDAFYLHKSNWTDEPMVHLLPHWNFEGMEGLPIKVMAHTNCGETELVLNERSLGKKKTIKYKLTSWEVPYEAGKIILKGFKDGSEVVFNEVHTAGKAVGLKLEAHRNFIYGDGLDAIPIEVSSVDSQGRFVPVCQEKVKFSVKGFGQIIGVGNGNPNSLEKDAADERMLFNGRCQAILQSLHGMGKINVTADSEDLESAELEFEVVFKDPPAYIESVYEKHIIGWRMTQKLFEERPDPLMEISDSDMNTFEPVEFNDSPQQKFDGKLNCYALYRTKCFINDENSSIEQYLKFYSLLGEIEVYVNDKKKAEKDMSWGGGFSVKLESCYRGWITLTVLIKLSNPHWPFAGICQSVVLCNDSGI